MPSLARPAALLLLLLVPLGAFLAGRPEPLPRADFTFVLPKENATVDPAAATSVADGWIVQALFEGLYRLDPSTLAPLPAAAESTELSADGLTYAFRLSPRARWSDGRPVTAGDFLYSWLRLLDARTGSSYASQLWVIAGAREFSTGAAPASAVGLAAPAPDTFVVHLCAPCPFFLALAAHFSCAPVRQDLIEAYGDAWTEPDRIVSNGPYRLELRRIRDRLRLVRNEQHARASATRLRVIDALAIDSKATALNLYLTGDADWVNALPAASLRRLHGRPDLRLNTVLATNFLRFNVTAPPLDDARVRRAIDLAIDREALCRFVYQSGEAPARSLVPPALPGYVPAAGAAGGIEAARALLAEAGFPGGRGFPELELLHAADESVRAVAEALSATLQQALGVRLRPAPQEFKVYLDSQKQLRYQVSLGMWIGDYPDPATFLDLFASDAGANRTGWKSARYDELLRQAGAEGDPARRAALLRKAEELLLREGPIAPICFRGQANLVSPRVTGFTTNLLDLHPLELLALR